VPLSDKDAATIGDRPNWTILNGRATFAPLERGWRAIVNRLQQPAGTSRYHIAVLDRNGSIRYTREVASVAEAARTAERDVAARNALRSVRAT
jgi:hypothetical protein